MTTSLITECYVGLGSNLDNPYAHVLDALWDIDQIEQTDLDSFSSLYTSRPMGPQDQPPYVNAAACLHTRLDAQSLLEALQAIEHYFLAISLLEIKHLQCLTRVLLSENLYFTHCMN